jgi:hypothetical protein
MRRINLEPGTRVGNYRILDQLGAGGMGEVYRAEPVTGGAVVALKVIDASHASPEEVARFLRAADAAAKLSHPNVVATHGAGQSGGYCHLAMELIDGVSVQQIVRGLASAPVGIQLVFSMSAARSAAATAPPPLTLYDLAIGRRPGVAFGDETVALGTTAQPHRRDDRHISRAAATALQLPHYHRMCCEWVRDAARGLHHAHQVGVIHRDVKPGNLMVGRDNRVRVIDFGLAHHFDDATLTRTGQLLGSPLYMSPEQVTGRIELTARTDVYSLGLVLYELLTLGPPVQAGNREELFQRIIAKPLDPLTRVNPAVGREIETVVHKATAKDPDERYQSAAAFADDLDRALAGERVQAPGYRPADDDDREALATRPNVVAVIAFHLYFVAAGWLGYGSFLLVVKDDQAWGRSGFPFVTLGWAGGVLAYGIGAAFALAGGWMSRRHRGGYWAGWLGLAGAVGTVAAVALPTAVRSADADQFRLFRIVLLSALLLASLGWQAVRYTRRSVRRWFDSALRPRR